MKAGNLASPEKWFAKGTITRNKALDYTECFRRCRRRT
jgi:hypothetical protein